MRIVFLLASSSTPTDATLRLPKAVEALGHEVLVLTAAPGSAVPSLQPEVRPLLLDPADDLVTGLLAADATAGPELGQAVRTILQSAGLRHGGDTILHGFRPDAVYECWAPYSQAGTGLAGALGIPLVLELTERAPDGHAPLAETARGLEHAALDAAAHVVATSPAQRDELTASGVDRSRIAVVAPGIDADGYDLTRPVRDALRSLLGVVDRQTVGIVADLVPTRDVDTVVRAVGALQRRGSDVMLLVAGDGPERSSLEELARTEGVDVSMAGEIPAEQIPAYLAAMDVAIAPAAGSGSASFPTHRLLEYLAAAVPVVAAGTPEIAHCIRDGETGLVYPPEDAESLAAALGGLLDDGDRARDLAESGREHVASSHSWSEAARTVVDLVRPADRETPANGLTPTFAGENGFAHAEPGEPDIETGPATQIESLPAG